MRPVPLLAALLLSLPGLARAGDLRHFDDAALHAVQFVDAREGWAVGDEGGIWHTIDGGRNWERQPISARDSLRSSLRSLHFLNPYVGWVAGREELAGGAGTAGVLLYTEDGGLHWQRVLPNALPGLNRVCFTDDKNGYLAGDGSDAYPSGLCATADGGRTWQPVPGPRCTAWWAAEFNAAGEGALAGAWNRQATVRRGKLFLVDSDLLGGRTLRGLQLRGENGIAVGEGGLVLLSDGSRGSSWNFADLRLPPHVVQDWDFHAVSGTGRHYWVVGRPGSVALHSPDLGRTWEVLRTGQTMPLHGIFFIDEKHGWAVGELGTVVATEDGGRTWRVQRRGGQRAAVLCAHARAAGTPLDTVAVLGAVEGYLTAAVRVTAPDPASAAPGRSGEGPRFAEAVRQAGGAAAEALWQFPIPSHLVRAGREDLLRSWDQLHGDKAAEQLLRQLVLAVRMWRPDVLLTDSSDASLAACDGLMAEAVGAAFERAADPQAFPEQIDSLGLEPWKVAKLYAPSIDRGAPVTLELAEPIAVLAGTVKEFVGGPAALVAEGPAAVPARRSFVLLKSRLPGAAGHRDLMQGVELAPGGVARRPLAAITEQAPEAVKVIRRRVHLMALSESPGGGLGGPEKLLGQIGPMLADLPEDQGARAADAVAWQYVRQGQWALARETFLLLADRYPAHPLALDACRWLVRHNSSSEARRRHELGQFLVLVAEDCLGQVREGEFQKGPEDPFRPGGEVSPTRQRGEDQDPSLARRANGSDPKQPKLPQIPVFENQRHGSLTVLASKTRTRQWYQGSLDLEPRLAAFGPLAANDPALQFCLQASRRNLGDREEPLKWYSQFAARQPEGPWRSAALAELWLARRVGPSPKPVLACRHTDTRPVLDGQADDPCWQHNQPVRLQNAAGETLAEYPTNVRLAYDKDFLYLLVQCKHPTERYVATVKGRGRDADLRCFDRVSILLDLDRDYSTCYHLQIDQRGCVCEDCWGDRRWDPRWFVAVRGSPEGWMAEAAIPLTLLTGDGVTLGHAWACNVVRVLPGRGVQAFSLPAEVPEETLRPEGMGLLLFSQSPK
jgi:photosystem II stability/assembly factor-like uncharacterized protein